MWQCIALLFLPLLANCQQMADIVCYRQWYFDRPRPAPRKCPPSDFFTYFECCGPLDDCCRRIRKEPVIVLIIVVLLLIFCCCCCILGFCCRRRARDAECEEEAEKETHLSKDERDCRQQY